MSFKRGQNVSRTWQHWPQGSSFRVRKDTGVRGCGIFLYSQGELLTHSTRDLADLEKSRWSPFPTTFHTFSLSQHLPTISLVPCPTFCAPSYNRARDSALPENWEKSKYTVSPPIPPSLHHLKFPHFYYQSLTLLIFSLTTKWNRDSLLYQKPY